MKPLAIWDLDNCLADDSGRIPLIDWHESDPDKRYERYHAGCGQDSVGNLKIFAESTINNQPLFITGRPEWTRRQTVEWIRKQLGVEHPAVLMRPNGNIESSVLLKENLLRSWLACNHGDVVAEAYDDHAGIIDMYRTKFGIQNSVLLRIHSMDAYRGEQGVVRAAAETDGEWPVQGARPVRKLDAADRLDEMAATFRQRNGVYRDNYHKVPELVKILFGEDGPPGSLVLRPEWHLFELILVKLTRFTQTELTHADSIHDAAIYSAMIDAILTQRAAAQGTTSK